MYMHASVQPYETLTVSQRKMLLQDRLKHIKTVCCPVNRLHEISVNISGDYVCSVCRKVLSLQGENYERKK